MGKGQGRLEIPRTYSILSLILSSQLCGHSATILLSAQYPTALRGEAQAGCVDTAMQRDPRAPRHPGPGPQGRQLASRLQCPSARDPSKSPDARTNPASSLAYVELQKKPSLSQDKVDRAQAPTNPAVGGHFHLRSSSSG